MTVKDRVEVIVLPHKGKRGTIIDLKESYIAELGPIATVQLDGTGEQVACQSPEIRLL